MKFSVLARRFLVPRFVVSLVYAAQYGCFVSHRAEVELSRNLKIGRNTQIGSFTKIKAADGPMSIGKETFVGPGCFITSFAGGIRIGDHVMVGANSCIIGSSYRYDDMDVPISKQGQISKGIVIGNNVWLGCGVVVTDGAQVGDGSIIAANSVVSGKIPSNSIAQGNPAKVVFVRR
jgi:acetyltransferase-like isoleucine patch superfamily enzyme